MSIGIKQAIPSNTRAGGGTLYYWIVGSMDPAAAKALLLATAPSNYNGAPQADYSIDTLDWQTHEAQVTYKLPSVTPPKEVTGNIFTQFNFNSGTVHITQSLETTRAYCAPCLNSRPGHYIWQPGGVGPPAWTLIPTEPADLPAVDGCTELPPVYVPGPFTSLPKPNDMAYGTLVPGAIVAQPPYTGGAIGITKDSIEGVDIDGGPLSFSKRVYLEELTDEQVARLAEAKNCCNANPWRLWDTGQVRFKGVSGGDQGRNNVEISLEFEVDANLSGFYVGTIGPITKLAHEYLWVYYKEFEDKVSHTITKKPAYAYVERVYGWSDFSIIDELLVPIFGITSDQESAF